MLSIFCCCGCEEQVCPLCEGVPVTTITARQSSPEQSVMHIISYCEAETNNFRTAAHESFAGTAFFRIFRIYGLSSFGVKGACKSTTL